MRIIAGTLKSRQFSAPKGFATHPMGDRIRTALFNTLGDIEGLRILDAFTGSGAVAFEALSRGAKTAILLDIDKEAIGVTHSNCTSLGLEDKATILNINARTWSNRNPNQLFDIVFCDPPYNNLQETVLEQLARHARPGGLIVYSLPPHADIRMPQEIYKLEVQKQYGDATLAFYRKMS